MERNCTSAPNAAMHSLEESCKFDIWEGSRSSARPARKLSPLRAIWDRTTKRAQAIPVFNRSTWSTTCERTPAESHSFVGPAMPLSIKMEVWKSTCEFTPARSPSLASSATSRWPHRLIFKIKSVNKTELFLRENEFNSDLFRAPSARVKQAN